MREIKRKGCLIGVIIVVLILVVLFIKIDYSNGQRGEFSFFFHDLLPFWHDCGVEPFYWDEDMGTQYRFWTSIPQAYTTVKTFPAEIYVPNADTIITINMLTILSYGYTKNEMVIYYLGEDGNKYVVFESDTEAAKSRLPYPYKNYIYPMAILIEESEIDSAKYTWVQFVDLQH